MDNLSNFPTNWNDLPDELKVMILRKMGNNCRLSLRACSKSDQMLVDYVPFRVIHEVALDEENGKWYISTRKTSTNYPTRLKFDNFQDFQVKLTNEIERNDYIKKLSINLKNSASLLVLRNHGELLKVGELHIYNKNGYVTKLLKQIESIGLRTLDLHDNGGNPAIFDLPQVIHCKFLSASRTYIYDSQLLQLKCEAVDLGGCKYLSLCSIQKYIQKQVLKLDNAPVVFCFGLHKSNTTLENTLKEIGATDFAKIDDENKKAIVKSESGNSQLDIKFSEEQIEGRTILMKNSFSDTSTIVDYMEISSTNTFRSLTITKRNNIQDHWEFSSLDESQMKLTEKINKVVCIKMLVITGTNDVLNLKSSKNEQLAVGELEILAKEDNVCVPYLQQIDQTHLKEISVREPTDSDEIFDTPQVIHAEKLLVFGCHIRDDQLTKLNAISLNYTENFEHQTLTVAGINAFLKKCVLNSNSYDFNMTIRFYFEENDTTGLYEDLNVFSLERTVDDEGMYIEKTVINSPYPEFQVALKYFYYTIQWRRISRIINFNDKDIQ